MFFIVPNKADEGILTFVDEIFVRFHFFLDEIAVCLPACVGQGKLFFDFDFFGFQETDVGELWLGQEKDGLSDFAGSCRSSNSVNEWVTVLWRVVLYNPINIGDVNTSGREISG